MTSEESRIYLESISNAKHLNADQRMQCNMFVGCIEYMESGGSRNDLDELLQKYEVIVPLNATKLEQKPIDNLKDIATLCKEIDHLTAEVDMLRKERDEAIKERDDSRWAAKYSIDALIKERDEARRELCNWSVGVGVKATNQAVAEERGWDCFKENQ